MNARTARRLRGIVLANKEAEAALLEQRKRNARGFIKDLKHELSDARRLEREYRLARWEAILDSLEDDGRPAIPKGHE